MELSIISSVQAGNRVSERLVKHFRELGKTCNEYVLGRFLNPCHGEAGLAPFMESSGAWTGKQLEGRGGIIFMEAVGIATRAVIPFLKDKTTDPAVVVVDRRGRSAISLLFGHIDGASELAGLAAEILGAVSMITTATDVNGRPAVDTFAKEQGFFISNGKMARKVPAGVLDGVPVRFFSDVPMEGASPDGSTQEEVCRRAV